MAQKLVFGWSDMFPYGTQCVDRQVADYFLDVTLAQSLGSGAGNLLAGE